MAERRAGVPTQGVWMHPLYGDRRLSGPAVAAVVTEVAPIVTLYANDFNVPGAPGGARVAFCPSMTFMTVSSTVMS